MLGFAVLILAMGAVMGQESPSAARSPEKRSAAGERRRAPAAKPPAADTRLALPKDAVETAPFTWRWTDKEGKRWIYRQTPFGLVRFEEREAVTEPPPGGRPPLEAYDEGEQVRFERMTPFGKQRWYRNKTELEGEEREAWERSRQHGAPPASEEKPEKRER
jgi:hypothetical protein